MCLAEAYFYVGSFENESEIPCPITDEHREQAYREIMDDDRLIDDVLEYTGVDWRTDDWNKDRWLTVCKLLRDNDEPFKKWWNERNARRVNNRAFDIAAEEGEKKYYEDKMAGPEVE